MSKDVRDRDIREDWFWNQWYSKDELELIWSWIQEGGRSLRIHFVDTLGKYAGFHPLDVGLEIGIAEQDTEEACRQWLTRLGFEEQPQ